MIPVTRKELYLNKIVGNDDYSVPEKPISEEELFFAEILGEAVQAPEPLTRYQMYLAKIAGRDIEIPTPITRLEYFLAKAAGMDITVPVPITREEIYWSNYTAIVEFEVENVPPLTYKAIEGTLKNYRIYGNTETKTRSYSGSAPLSFPIENGAVSNYRIYGNTVNSESVGDKTENLFDGTFIHRSVVSANVSSDDPNRRSIVINISSLDNGNKITFSRKTSAGNQFQMYQVTSPLTGGRLKSDNVVSDNPETLLAAITLGEIANYPYLMIFLNGATNTITDEELLATNIMLNTGTTALPYEPYGYRIPITNNSETANIYLDEPLTKSGNNADYIDYAEQKRYNADGTNEDVSLLVLPAQSSTNSLSVGTSVQPSSVAVDVGEIVSCGDKVTDSQSVNYGKYKIPVTLTADSAETSDIYLDEPLAKSGNNADYIDYATQKRHNSDGMESSVTLPEIAVTAGTNTLSVGTEVQPSKVYIKGEKEREYT